MSVPCPAKSCLFNGFSPLGDIRASPLATNAWHSRGIPVRTGHTFWLHSAWPRKSPEFPQALWLQWGHWRTPSVASPSAAEELQECVGSGQTLQCLPGSVGTEIVPTSASTSKFESTPLSSEKAQAGPCASGRHLKNQPMNLRHIWSRPLFIPLGLCWVPW
uniref:Uncharacterized protein n=1 Tax=Myotis myotis TaxID=51298 RepID=A0A7J7WHQ6_MYOMY|nr:hypothetical protein mMyoMyo1_012136 [Myotis myotis]